MLRRRPPGFCWSSETGIVRSWALWYELRGHSIGLTGEAGLDKVLRRFTYLTPPVSLAYGPIQRGYREGFG